MLPSRTFLVLPSSFFFPRVSGDWAPGGGQICHSQASPACSLPRVCCWCSRGCLADGSGEGGDEGGGGRAHAVSTSSAQYLLPSGPRKPILCTRASRVREWRWGGDGGGADGQRGGECGTRRPPVRFEIDAKKGIDPSRNTCRSRFGHRISCPGIASSALTRPRGGWLGIRQRRR